MARRVVFPTLTPDRKRIVWYEVRSGSAPNICAAPPGLMMPNIAQIRLVETGGGRFVGMKLLTNGGVEFIEGEDLRDKMQKAIRTPYWVRLRDGKLTGGEIMHDIIYLSFKCRDCGKFFRPVDGIDPDNRTAWDMKCGACRATEVLPNW